MLVVSASTLNLVVKKAREPRENNSEDLSEKKQRIFFIVFEF